jgi:hypothetical protein
MMLAEIPFPFIQIHIKVGRLDSDLLAFADTGRDGDIILPLSERRYFGEMED